LVNKQSGEKKMKPIILFSSRGGNTEKVAAAIASEIKCESIKITKETANNSVDLASYDFFFIGTGIHYGSGNEDLLAYLKNANFPSSRRCAIFITWGGAGKTSQDVLNTVRTILESKGQIVVGQPFFCYGGWNFLKRGHPKADELQAAKKWANKTLKV
jgi:flavodoxin